MKYLDKIIEYGILLFVFLIPAQARLILAPGQINGGYWEYGTQSLYATEVLLAVILILLIGKFCLRFVETSLVSTRRGFGQRFLSPAGALLLFLLYVGLSVFWAIDKNTALIHWRWLVEAGAVLLALSSGFIKREKIYWAIILSAVIQAMWGIGQWLTQSIPASTILGMARQGAEMLGASVVETLDGRWLRAYGSFPHPNILGGWLVLSLLLAMREVKRTPFAYIAIALLSAGLAVTFSRGAWLAFGAGLAAYILIALIGLLQSRVRSFATARAGALALVVITLFVGALVASYPEPFTERAFGGGRLEVKSTGERASGINEAWQLVREHPVIGVGAGNYGLAVHRDIDASKPAYYYQPVHTVVLLVVAELGLIGIFAFGFWILTLLRYIRRAEPLIILAPLVVLSLFDHYLWSLYSGMMIGAVYLGIFYLRLDKS